MVATDDKLAETVAMVQEKWGAKALHRWGQSAKTPPSTLASGLPALDGILGGGFPCGYVAEISGQPTAGITSLALCTLAQTQRRRGSPLVAYLDFHHTFDPLTAIHFGVDLTQLLLIRPINARQAIAVLRDIILTEAMPFILLDARWGWLNDPQLSRTFSTTLAQLIAPLHRNAGILLCLTLLPHPAIQASHNPLAHYAALRLQLTRQNWLYEGEELIGYETKIEVTKNKLGRTGQHVTVPFHLPPHT